MSNVVADGSILAFGATFGATKNCTAISNANPAVATLEAAHGVVVGDLIEFLTSGWPSLAGKVLRVSAVSTNDVTLEGFSTSDTTRFPAGGGTGTIREILTWTNVAQIVAISQSGGEQKYVDFQYLDQLQEQSVPTSKSPLRLSFTLADDITLAQQASIRALETLAANAPARLVFRNNSRILMNGFWSMANLPNIELGAFNKREVTIALSSLPTEYAT